jgi:hypothetical protein
MNQKEYNNKINRLSKIMSLESKVNIVGSAKIKRSLYHTPPRINKGSQGSRGSQMPLRKLKPSHDSFSCT